MANTEIFLRNIFGTTRPNIRPLVLALNITNDLLFEQHISMSDIKATKHIYPDVARLLHKKPETVYKSVIRLAHRCWDALVEQDLVLSYLGRSMKQEPDPSVFITYLLLPGSTISPCWNLFPIDTLTGACVPLNFLLYFSMQSALTNLSALLKL